MSSRQSGSYRASLGLQGPLLGAAAGSGLGGLANSRGLARVSPFACEKMEHAPTNSLRLPALTATLVLSQGKQVAKAKKKLSLKQAAGQLTALAEKHLSALPEEEQDARVAAFARRDFKSDRGGHTKSSVRVRTRASRASTRGR